MIDELALRDVCALTSDRTDVPRLLLASDVFFFPSSWEGLPGAPLEALAAGLPLVASDIPSVREIAPYFDDAVLMAPATDADGHADHIVRVLNTTRDRAQARRHFAATPFALEHAVDAYRSLYGLAERGEAVTDVRAQVTRLALLGTGVLALRNDDVILAAFPRSGSTWTRHVLCNLISLTELGGADVEPMLDRTMPALGSERPAPAMAAPHDAARGQDPSSVHAAVQVDPVGGARQGPARRHGLALPPARGQAEGVERAVRLVHPRSAARSRGLVPALRVVARPLAAGLAI